MPNNNETSNTNEQAGASIAELQSWWEVPSIAHFCSLFREAFELMEFDIEELELALINGENDTYTGSIPLVHQLVITLLQGCTGRKDINLSNYDQYLKEFLTNKYYEEKRKPNNWHSLPEFNVLPLRKKVVILHHLCDYRLDPPDAAEMIKNWESDILRVEPLGQDQYGSNYWYFYGTRLYLESFEKKQNVEKKKSQSKVRKRKTSRRQRNHKNNKKGDANEMLENDKHYNVLSAKSTDSAADWKVICNTEEEWTKLTERFSKSQNRKEKDLHKRLVNDFLPEIGKLFIEKEKQLKKKLLEMGPKRVSHRIEKFKQQERERTAQKIMEEEKLQEELKARRTEEEKQRKQREIKERECRALERMQMKEDRARRAIRRRETGDLQLDEVEPCFTYSITSSGRVVHKPSMTHGTRGSTSYFENTEAQRMYKVLQTVQKHKDAWPFRDPIDERYAPGYFSFIEKPMDLSTIGKKLHNGQYKNSAEFEQDFVLMFENCRKYNGSESEYTQMAETVKKLFDSLMKNAFPLLGAPFNEKLQYVTYSRTKTPNVDKTIPINSVVKVEDKSKIEGVPMNKSTAVNIKTAVSQARISTSTTPTPKLISVAASKVSPVASIIRPANSNGGKESFLKMQLSQGYQNRFPIKIISSTPSNSVQQRPTSQTVPTTTYRNGINSSIRNQLSSNSTSKLVLLTSKGNISTEANNSKTTQNTSNPSKITVIKLANNKKVILSGDQVSYLPTSNSAQTTSKVNDVPIKRVYKVVTNGTPALAVRETPTKAAVRPTLNEPMGKRVMLDTVLNVAAPSLIEPSPQHISHPAIIDPSHAGYCIQVPTVTNCTQQQIVTVPAEGQQYDISNGSTIIQPTTTFIQSQVQTQPMQYNYIDVGQLHQQQQLVIPVNSQIVYTTPEVVTTNVGSLLQVYPNMVIQVAPSVQQTQQQVVPVQYYDAITTGVLS